MSEATYSFIYDRMSADDAFHGITVRELALSMLAGVRPESSWDGCVVCHGPNPVEGAAICLATRGPGADELQLRVIGFLERNGIRILQVY